MSCEILIQGLTFIHTFSIVVMGQLFTGSTVDPNITPVGFCSSSNRKAYSLESDETQPASQAETATLVKERILNY